MRIKIVLGAWLLGIALAWLAVAPVDLGVWQVRQQALYLTGLWSIGLMSLAMALALRPPWMERPQGGMDPVYRLHKWAGIGAAVAAILHWAVDESSDWITALWGRAGRLARDAAADPLLPRLRSLCENAQPPVALTVYSEARGQRLTPQSLEAGAAGPLDICFCGPRSLGDALHAHAVGPRPWRLHRESFAMR